MTSVHVQFRFSSTVRESQVMLTSLHVSCLLEVVEGHEAEHRRGSIFDDNALLAFSFILYCHPCSCPFPVLSPSLPLSLKNIYHPFTPSGQAENKFLLWIMYFHLTCTLEAHSASSLIFNTSSVVYSPSSFTPSLRLCSPAEKRWGITWKNEVTRLSWSCTRKLHRNPTATRRGEFSFGHLLK